MLDSQGYELRWVLDGDDVVLQLVAKIGKSRAVPKLTVNRVNRPHVLAFEHFHNVSTPPFTLSDANEYMAFGLSKNDTRSEMIGADVVVAYFDETTGRSLVDLRKIHNVNA